VGAAIRRALERHAPLRAEFRGPAFAFPEREHADAGDAVRVTAANSDLLEALPEWRADLDEVDPCFAVVRDGRAVSICASARTARRAAEAGVETLPEWRGKGFATTATAAWAREIRRRGLEPLYSTTWDNRASRGVARRLGLVLYAEDWHWT
jgi:RimJ/RimL family protein N-acetyltransferase